MHAAIFDIDGTLPYSYGIDNSQYFRFGQRSRCNELG
jgi:hypothetical protein